eukprot:TRINITY_DN20018_c0_g1_i1.p1 TRINITY_DN20018_c0_g1~~TRINITY_DN20018_c0_g1_i1.p1  ORF type:complete len:674 (+),score=114.67 TRINITY_DN20018_c0_g1_i1:38-2023(+)
MAGVASPLGDADGSCTATTVALPSERLTGTVKSFKYPWGWIVCPEISTDMFAHVEDVRKGTLSKDAEVTFQALTDEKTGKPRARMIEVSSTRITRTPGEEVKRLEGTVKSFRASWGWLCCDEVEGDIFAHIDDVAGGIVPRKGTIVSFEAGEDVKTAKPRAVRIEIIGSGEQGAEEEDESTRCKGVLRSWREPWGWIQSPDAPGDLFAHFEDIRLGTPRKGATVTFEHGVDDKSGRPRAVRIEIADDLSGQLVGMLTEWRESYGWITCPQVPDGDVFAHGQDFAQSLPASVGDEVTFYLGNDDKGRRRAQHILPLWADGGGWAMGGACSKGKDWGKGKHWSKGKNWGKGNDWGKGDDWGHGNDWGKGNDGGKGKTWGKNQDWGKGKDWGKGNNWGNSMDGGQGWEEGWDMSWDGGFGTGYDHGYCSGSDSGFGIGFGTSDGKGCASTDGKGAWGYHSGLPPDAAWHGGCSDGWTEYGQGCVPGPDALVGHVLEGEVCNWKDAWGWVISPHFAGELFVHSQEVRGGGPVPVGTWVTFTVGLDRKQRLRAFQVDSPWGRDSSGDAPTKRKLLLDQGHDPSSAGQRHEGEVSSWRSPWGWIRSEGVAGDVFVHKDDVEGQQELVAGQAVCFVVGQDASSGRSRAMEVTVVESAVGEPPRKAPRL